MKKIHIAFIAICSAFTVYGQDTTVINRYNPSAMSKLVAPNARLEKIPGKYIFTEGPVWNKKGGYLLFSDVPANVIYKYIPVGESEIFMNKSGYTESDSLPTKNAGSNGLAYDTAGNLVICRHGDRNVVRILPDNKTEIIAAGFESKRLNSPNDLCISKKGTVFFTDPPYGLNKNRPQEVKYNGVYKVSNGKIELIDSTFSRPNGIILSPDEKYLYVNNSDKARMIWKRYKLDKEGNIIRSNIFFDATGMVFPGSADGMKADKKGNIYAAGPGGLIILSPQGEMIGSIKTNSMVTNCAFGDTDGKTLYITARTEVYKIRLLIPGDGF
jgi:gluconolactonase